LFEDTEGNSEQWGLQVGATPPPQMKWHICGVGNHFSGTSSKTRTKNYMQKTLKLVMNSKRLTTLYIQ